MVSRADDPHAADGVRLPGIGCACRAPRCEADLSTAGSASMPARLALASPIRPFLVASSGEPPDGIFPPTLVLDVPPGARVLQEETFRPLLPIVPVRDAWPSV